MDANNSELGNCDLSAKREGATDVPNRKQEKSGFHTKFLLALAILVAFIGTVTTVVVEAPFAAAANPSPQSLGYPDTGATDRSATYGQYS